MFARNLVRWSSRAIFFSSSALAFAGVHIVDGSGVGSFTTIQAAVDASVDGDVILVRGGNYAAFTVDNKSLAIYADADADVEIAGALSIKNVAAAKTVVVSGIHVTGTSTTPAPTVALSLTHNAGALRFQKCAFTGGQGLSTFIPYPPSHPPAAHGVVLLDNPSVAFVGCTLQGGNAYMDGENCYECTGGAGGDGVVAQTSAVALYDTLCIGGLGGESGGVGGTGGSGYHALDWGGFASRSTFKGGKGGNAWDFLSAFGGNGGHGLALDANAGFHLLSDTYVAGAGGISYLFPNDGGAPGQTIHGSGLVDMLPGHARVFSASTLADTGGSIDLTVFGQPGDKVYLPESLNTGFKYKPLVSGVWLIPFPAYIPVDPMGVIPASGMLTLQARVVSLPSGTDAGVSFMQGFIIDAEGSHTLGSPIDVLLMRCASLAPDCNANGRFDTCDLFQQLSVDCDANSIPDECQPDCNHNNTADSCDIAAHTSVDTNHNGVPDECEQVNATWYVDAAAAPGGNGSSSNPFQTIAQGLSSSLNGHTVIVRDGVYTGANNKNLDFGGRNVLVRSQNGPANCIIDCQQNGRAFMIQSGETAAAILDGLTIKNGSTVGVTGGFGEGGALYIWNASPTIRNCVFTGCTAATDGGALFVFNSNSVVRNCTFTLNQVLNQGNGSGGAVECVYKHPQLVDCFFVNNVAARSGGAVLLAATETQPQLLSHCVFLSNSALERGGAVYHTGIPTNSVAFDDCLIAGNSAPEGGGILGNGDLVISNSTIVGNRATVRGGGIGRYLDGTGSIVNSIVWGNSAPSGPQISVADNSSFDVNRCDSQGGQAAVFVAAGAVLNWGVGNIALDPKFVDPNGPDGNPGTVGDNDYRLSLLSPCIDAGDNALVAPDLADLDGDNDTSEPVPFDLDLLPRFKDIPSVPDTGAGTAPIVDMGAYERQS